MSDDYEERARVWIACVRAAAMAPEGEVEALAGLLRTQDEKTGAGIRKLMAEHAAERDQLRADLAAEREWRERLRAVALQAAQGECAGHWRMDAALAALHPGDLDGGDRG